MSDNKRVRNWVFTVNNWTLSDIDLFGSLECSYLCYGKEVGESGTPHLQGMVVFENPRKLTGMKRIHPTAHWEPMKGTFEQAREYCIKDGDIFERGCLPASQKEKGVLGKRALEERWELAKQGKFQELDPENIKVYEYIYAKYSTKPMDNDILENLWIVGPSGCGKSRKIRQEFPEFYSKPMSKWWDGYQLEETVVLDDFDPSHGKFLEYYLKIWADHYAFNAEVKGGMLNIRPKRIIVTSQYTIEECFESVEGREALNRRFKVEHMVNGYKNGSISHLLNLADNVNN